MKNGSYSKGVLEFVKEKNPLSAFFAKSYSLKEGEKAYFTTCPFCGKKDSFAISKAKEVYHCFSCGENGDIYSYLMKTQKISLAEATEYLALTSKIHLPSIQAFNESEQEELYEINKESAIFYVRELFGKDRRGLDYLRDVRKLSDNTIRTFGLGYARSGNGLTEHLLKRGYSVKSLLASGMVCEKDNRIFDRFRNRVMFPIMDKESRVIGFNGRVLDGSTPKYLNTPETLLFDKGRLFYGMQNLQKGLPIILCEGNLDVISLIQSGANNVVATLGTSLNEHHIEIIKAYTDILYLVYDSDTAGRNATEKVVRKFGKELDIRIVNLSHYKDPDEAIRAGSRFEDFLKKAVSVEET